MLYYCTPCQNLSWIGSGIAVTDSCVRHVAVTGIQWYNNHTKFRENRPTDSNVEKESTSQQGDDTSLQEREVGLKTCIL
jgi:hypothetical protein